jgi:rhamnosyltransferase subunit B
MGSEGDARPFVGIARALNHAGHHATLLCDPHYAALAHAHGVETIDLPLDIHPDRVRDHPGLLSRWRGPGVILNQLITPTLRDLFLATGEAIETIGPNVVVAHQIAMASVWAAEQRGVKRVIASTAPSAWPSLADPNRYPVMPDRDQYRMWLVKAGMTTARMVARWCFDATANRHRAEAKLPPRRDALVTSAFDADASLGLWSPLFRDIAADDPLSCDISGYVYLDDPDEAWRETPQAVQDFIKSGLPPVLLTLGSTARYAGHDVYREAAHACAELGLRALILAPPDVVADEALPDGAARFDAAPHAGVLPRCAAVLHHGGAGTTAETLRSGRPSVVVPFANDMFDNARRARRLGVSVTVPRGRARQPRLVEAFARALELRDGAQDVARQISAEDWEQNVVHAVAGVVGEGEEETRLGAGSGAPVMERRARAR